MTEDEAKQKWCPFVRVTITPDDIIWEGNMLTNRGQIPASNTDTLCIASDCMMWEPERRSIERTLGGHNIHCTDGGYCKLGKL